MKEHTELIEELRSDIEMTVFANVRSFAENPTNDVEQFFLIDECCDRAEVAALFVQNDVDALNSMLDDGRVRFLVKVAADKPNLVAFNEIDDDQNCRGLFITPMQLVQLC